MPYVNSSNSHAVKYVLEYLEYVALKPFETTKSADA